MLLPLYLDRIAAGSVSPTAQGRIVSDERGAVTLDAENVLGQVSSERAVVLAMARLRDHAVASVAVRNGFHFGAAGYWAAKMAARGAIGIAMSNTRPLLPPPGGVERVVGNNPLAVAIPGANGEPVVLDLAFSAGAMQKIRMAEAAGEPIPVGWAADAAGKPTTDAGEAIRGMLLPAGGAKGFGLAAIVDLLAGGLSGGAIGDQVRPLYGDMSEPYRCSHLFMAIDVAAFRPLIDLEAAVSVFVERVRGSKPRDGMPAVRMPGDRARQARSAFSGSITLTPATAQALQTHATRLGVDVRAAIAG
jgi:LDH2 family malate/lactate/ureidoglycolate dehydrogenase